MPHTHQAERLKSQMPATATLCAFTIFYLVMHKNSFSWVSCAFAVHVLVTSAAWYRPLVAHMADSIVWYTYVKVYYIDSHAKLFYVVNTSSAYVSSVSVH